MNNWMWIGLLIAAGYVCICVAVYFVQDFFLFHPEKLPPAFQFKYDTPFEEVVLEGLKGSTIDGLYFPAENSDKVVFYFKGNTRSIKGWAKFEKDFTSKNCNFFIIDYPGFGKSTGKRDVKTIYHNALVAYNWLKTKHNEKNILIYGRSLGAGFAAYVAKENHPHLLILDSPYISMKRLAGYYTRILPMWGLLKYKVPLGEYLKELHCPTFILHGSKDLIIPYKYSQELQKLAPDRIKLFTIKNGRHNNLPRFKTYHATLYLILNDPKLHQQYLST